MPIYEFTCTKCQTDFEELVASMTSKTNPACPKCQSSDTNKKVSVFSPQTTPSTPPQRACGMTPDGTCSSGGCPFNG